MQNYVTYKVRCSDDVKELAIAELADIGFEGFTEDDKGFSAYISEEAFNEEETKEIFSKYKLGDFEQVQLPAKNWNAEWEKDFKPIIIKDKVVIRAPFHELKGTFNQELIIQPKNTFGTGHHETTRLMIDMMTGEEFAGARVLDYGSGTGVLGIMASKLGAVSVLGIDIDAWSAENIDENLQLNKVNNFSFIKGDLSVVPDQKFDVVLANINKNILLRSIERMAELIKEEGHLYISGFYESDLDDLKVAFLAHGLHMSRHEVENGWCAAMFKLFHIPL